jgi:hypothetical protein
MNFTVRFFEVEDIAKHGEALASVLDRLEKWALPGREKDVSGVILRLEHLEKHGDLYLGDLTRVQKDNLPGVVTDKGIDPLPVRKLGHYIGFCYDAKANAIAVQFDLHIRVGMVMKYFSEVSTKADYRYLPLLNQASIEKFGKEHVKSLDVRVSKMRNFSKAEPAKTDFEASIDQMAKMYDAPVIRVRLSSKSRKKPLDKGAVIETVRRMLVRKEETDSVAKLEASTWESEHAYKFLTQLLVSKGSLSLPNNSPLDHRTKRLARIKECYDEHIDYIRSALGAD